ncbi:unnamed protein product, partial [Brassica rapa subsp. trilocularis]
MYKIFLYMETKILIRLNTFDSEDFLKTYGTLMEDLCKTHARLMEDFDLGEKPKLFHSLGVNSKFYLNLDGCVGRLL